MNKNENGEILCIRFNEDNSLFATARTDGVRVYNVTPLRELAHYDANSRHLSSSSGAQGSACEKKVQGSGIGSISSLDLLWRTNAIAMVASTPNTNHGGRVGENFRPKFMENVVVIMDNDTLKVRTSVTVATKVLGVRLKRDKIVVICSTEIHVFSFPLKPKRLFSIATCQNDSALCEISPLRRASSLGTSSGMSSSGKEFMIFPGFKLGSLQILDLSVTEHNVSSAPVSINAHKSKLACIAINQQGTLIGTGSEKGTLIRVWDSNLRVMLVELRRGVDTAHIYCISFSHCNQWLCCSSDKGTVHIFALQDYKLNKHSTLSSLSKHLISSSTSKSPSLTSKNLTQVASAYAGSQWSLASFTVSGNHSSSGCSGSSLSTSMSTGGRGDEMPCVCAFGPWEASGVGSHGRGTVYAACMDGSFHKYQFSPDGSTQQVAFDIFTQMCINCIWDKLRIGQSSTSTVSNTKNKT